MASDGVAVVVVSFSVAGGAASAAWGSPSSGVFVGATLLCGRRVVTSAAGRRSTRGTALGALGDRAVVAPGARSTPALMGGDSGGPAGRVG